jgi:hypothetical protein
MKDRMIEIPVGPNYDKNYNGLSRYDGPCIVCGKDIKNARWGAYHNEDGSMVIHPDDLEDRYNRGDADDDMGIFPIGNDCRRNLTPEQREYTLPYNTY